MYLKHCIISKTTKQWQNLNRQASLVRDKKTGHHHRQQDTSNVD